MDITNALVPVQDFFPSRTSIDGLWVNLDHDHERSWEEVIFTEYMPDEIEGIYGSDGSLVVKLKTGGFIDIYV